MTELDEVDKLFQENCVLGMILGVFSIIDKRDWDAPLLVARYMKKCFDTVRGVERTITLEMAEELKDDHDKLTVMANEATATHTDAENCVVREIILRHLKPTPAPEVAH